MAPVTKTSWGVVIHPNAHRFEAAWWGNGWFYPAVPDRYDLAPNGLQRCPSGWEGFPCTQRVAHKGCHAASDGKGHIVAEWGMKP